MSHHALFNKEYELRLKDNFLITVSVNFFSFFALCDCFSFDSELSLRLLT